MTIKKNYNKAEASREPLKPLISPKNNDLEAIPLKDLDTINLPSIGYYKTDIGRDLYSFFVVVSGGIRREKDYFKYIIDNPEDFRNIKIEFVAKDDETGEEGLCPLKMYDVALRKKHDFFETKGGLPDRIVLIVDVDNFEAEILAIQESCRTENMGLYISNCCFEMWLYYGYFDVKPQDFPDVEAHKRSQAMKKYLGENVKGGAKPKSEILKIRTAMTNSRKNYEEDDNGLPKLFSTNLHLLGEEIHPLIEGALAIWDAKLKAQQDKYKK